MTRLVIIVYQICTQETVRSVRHNKMQAGLRSLDAHKGYILFMTAVVWQSHLHPSGSETQQYNTIRSQHHAGNMATLEIYGGRAQPSRELTKFRNLQAFNRVKPLSLLLASHLHCRMHDPCNSILSRKQAQIVSLFFETFFKPGANTNDMKVNKIIYYEYHMKVCTK